MVVEPERHIAGFAKASAPIIPWSTPEASATFHLHRVLSQIRELGKKAAVVLDPPVRSTPSSMSFTLA